MLWLKTFATQCSFALSLTFCFQLTLISLIPNFFWTQCINFCTFYVLLQMHFFQLQTHFRGADETVIINKSKSRELT
jgi:hypothetical protein